LRQRGLKYAGKAQKSNQYPQRFGRAFHVITPRLKSRKWAKLRPHRAELRSERGSPLWSGLRPATWKCPIFANSGDARALLLPWGIGCEGQQGPPAHKQVQFQRGLLPQRFAGRPEGNDRNWLIFKVL
jgi:hypothetical protein